MVWNPSSACTLKLSDVFNRHPKIEILNEVFLINEACLFGMSSYLGSTVKQMMVNLHLVVLLYGYCMHKFSICSRKYIYS